MTKFNKEKFRTNVITYRLLTNNWSMDQASKMIGISKATISRIEKGGTPDIDTFLKIVSWLGKDTSEYFIKDMRSKSEIKRQKARVVVKEKRTRPF